jgi:hypothetical protein
MEKAEQIRESKTASLSIGGKLQCAGPGASDSTLPYQYHQLFCHSTAWSFLGIWAPAAIAETFCTHRVFLYVLETWSPSWFAPSLHGGCRRGPLVGAGCAEADIFA